ncbi:GntR family transcriptional regulator [Kaistia dalseonensis]|uniref:DNA-binding GntR family transcriptional regulator n=1 Tax=Kaistia dalseonensis TaxID=410840 RepID=A0ABU0H428_9HYPH|nr:GntR family transcriptional regulator [Kaistia dalseonensis]MCX5494477.1 GntR family transcriptional regulator [Kaistia dalseonensis]MDQ0437056.1 DNA-binding GntR family transcriptional regulator [Kaistia dalseonensis]
MTVGAALKTRKTSTAKNADAATIEAGAAESLEELVSAPASVVAPDLRLVDTEAGDSTRKAGSTPRYLTLARALQDAIRAGTYPVGSLLPTEVELATLYSVSRQTVRQAIGVLRQQGQLSARKGVGTRVEASGSRRQFTYSASSVSDLIEIAHDWEVVIHSSEMVTARGALATELGCRSGHRWLRLDCSRTVDGESRPMSWVEVYLDGRVSQNLKLPRTMRSALFAMVEKQTGEIFSDIQQEIRATLIDEAMAKRLDAPVGSPALQITRRYYSTGRRLVEVAINTMPADRFFYSVAITRN